MSYPAFDAIATDIELGFARWKVWMHLQPPVLTHHTATPVKVVGIATALHMSPRNVIDALEWLTRRGYVIEHSRDRGVRALLLAWHCPPTVTEPDRPHDAVHGHDGHEGDGHDVEDFQKGNQKTVA